MSLLRAELRRLVKRRLTRYLLAVVVAGLAAIAVGTVMASQQLTPATIAQAEAKVAVLLKEAQAQHAASVASCEAAEARGETGLEQRFGPNCGRAYAPDPDTFSPQLPFEFDFREQASVMIGLFAGILALFGFLVGASYVGAEWSSGGMTNLLLWRPARLTVLITKLGVLLGAVLAVALPLGAVWTFAFWLIGRYDGRSAGVTAGLWRSLALDGVRGIGLALAVTAVGFAVASMGRHTAAALGAAVAVTAASEIGVRMVTTSLNVPYADRYVLSTYARAWLEKRYVLEDWTACGTDLSACTVRTSAITWSDSALVLGVGVAAVLVAATWLMRRRDIT
ncbi:MAG TPA: ABC transporter permease subunit [Pilimelia sp.]|nr:ABC transporter permease subunit [Pilimelia sp.]